MVLRGFAPVAPALPSGADEVLELTEGDDPSTSD